MESDLSDIQKIEKALVGGSAREDESSPIDYGDSADGFSEASSYQQHLTPQEENSFSIFEELTTDSVEDDAFVIDELEPSLENALYLNKAYQSMLTELSQQLDVLRAINREKQRTLQEEIDNLTALANKKPENRLRRKKVTFTFFGMPYFKDSNYAGPPKNEDAQLAESIGFRNVSLINCQKPFTKFEVRKFRGGLREQTLRIEANRLMRKREELQSQLTLDNASLLTEENRKAISKEIDSIQRQIYDINSLPDEKLFDVSPELLTWDKLAIDSFHRSRNPDQLRLFFMHYLRPGVNRKAWTAAENRQLKELVKKYKDGIDWDEVAKDMMTHRTPFECFRRYQERFNPEHRKFGWSKEDNIKLMNLITNYGDRSVGEIDWEEIRLQFPGRSKTQVYAHFRYHTQISDPRPFTAEEDVVILEGIKMGYKYPDIKLLLGKRSTLQIRFRYRAIKNRGKGSEREWTEKENNLLLNMKSASRLRNKVIHRDFPGRSFAQLFSRFHYLRMKLTTPQKYIEELKAKRRMISKTLPKSNIKTARKIVDVLSQFRPSSPKKTKVTKRIPQFKNELLHMTKRCVREPKSRFGRPARPAPRPKRSIAQKEKELKEILRPYIGTNAYRPRKLSFPGDGREYGIVLATLYRLLQCNFTLAPQGEPTEEEMEEFGIGPEDYLSYLNLLTLTKEAPKPVIGAAPETILCLPPTMSTLTGFRGLLLHRKYIQSSASSDYTPPNCATITECPEEPVAGPSGQQDEPIVETNEIVQQDSETIPQQDNDLDASMVVSKIPDQVPVRDKTIPVEGPSEKDAAEDVEVEGENPEKTQKVPQRSLVLSDIIRDQIEDDLEVELMNDGDDRIKNFVVTIGNSSATYEVGEGMDEDRSFHSESEEEEEEELFGNAMADSLLLSRLLSLFYWPGIMSTMHVPDELKQEAAERAANESNTTVKEPVTPKETKQEMRDRRRAHIQSIVRKRYNKPEPPTPESAAEPVASTSANPEQEVEPPSAKKTRRTYQKKQTPPIPESDRVTRTRRSRAATK